MHSQTRQKMDCALKSPLISFSVHCRFNVSGNTKWPLRILTVYVRAILYAYHDFNKGKRQVAEKEIATEMGVCENNILCLYYD